MANGDFKDLTRRTAFDKIMCDKAFNIAKIQNKIDINMDLLQWSVNFFDNSIYQKIPEKKSILNFYRQYLGHRSGRYAINK